MTETTLFSKPDFAKNFADGNRMPFGPAEEKLINRGFSWASMMLILFYMHEGTFAKLKTVADFKKAFSSFNDFVQELEIPEPEAQKNEL